MRISTSGLRVSLALAGVTAAALIAAASPAAAQPTGITVGSMCAVGSDSGGVSSARGTAREPAMTQRMQEVPASALAKMSAKAGVVSIPIYFHVITDGTTGLVSDTTINNQIVALNKSYSGQLGGVNTGFRFRVAGVDHTNNAAWFAVNPGDPAEKEMKRAPAQKQWAMNHCLAEIGIHHPKLRKRAIRIGERLAVLIDYPASPGCTPPYAPIWIAEMVRRREESGGP